tara:strand:+ start:356 stop:973 length:618 start_codon:yes stop_codon:yes gene_type:complete
MKSKREISERMRTEMDDRVVEALMWVLEDDGCAFCSHPQRRDLEVRLRSNQTTATFVETKLNWPVGTVRSHMDTHIEADPVEEAYVESMRKESINTLNTAEGVVMRLQSYLDEWEQQKDINGIDAEWIAMATSLTRELKGGLKLVGTLKKEIGVESQILLMRGRQDALMRILISELEEQPQLLDNIHREMMLLEAPVFDVEGDVL